MGDRVSLQHRAVSGVANPGGLLFEGLMTPKSRGWG